MLVQATHSACHVTLCGISPAIWCVNILFVSRTDLPYFVAGNLEPAKKKSQKAAIRYLGVITHLPGNGSLVDE